MKRIKPGNLIKPSRPILINLSEMSRSQMRDRLMIALKARGFTLAKK